MTRSLPLDAPDLAILRPPREPFLEAEVHLVTPMFGGGAEPGQSDLDYPVRGSTVRGHLRFWWRACSVSRFTSVEEMFEAEAAIWGQSANAKNSRSAPSSVDVSVSIIDPGHLRACAEPSFNPRGTYRAIWRVGQSLRSLPYVLWPFQGEGAGGTVTKLPAQMREGLRFRASFNLAGHVASEGAQHILREVRSALWAWVAFGGLGARTRRGCGALYCPTLAHSGVPARSVTDGAKLHVVGAVRELPIPSLRGAVVLLGQESSPLTAWNEAIGWMQFFRQGVEFARNPGERHGNQPSRPGRSRWPEPDSVRQLLSLSDERHPPIHPARPLFPRADLGLPIVFQQMVGSPHTLEAAGDQATRFASPVVLKPFAISPDRAVPMALVFNTPHVWEVTEVTLYSARRKVSVPRTQLHDPARSHDVPPLANYSTAREAFLAYVRRPRDGQRGNVSAVIL